MALANTTTTTHDGSQLLSFSALIGGGKNIAAICMINDQKN
jgi:hypothetical protein